ncbi:MAG: hypothetical protein ACYCOU_04100 [Sulfobacillus sp.]
MVLPLWVSSSPIDGKNETFPEMETERLNTHFDFLLAKRKYPPTIAAALKKYRAMQCYPQNTERSVPVPRFVDCFGNRCAVAHLIESTSSIDVLALNREFEYSEVPEIWEKCAPFRQWSAEQGMSVDQLSEIQPNYPPGVLERISREMFPELHQKSEARVRKAAQCLLPQPSGQLKDHQMQYVPAFGETQRYRHVPGDQTDPFQAIIDSQFSASVPVPEPAPAPASVPAPASASSAQEQP